jgi:putative PIN family toxin of toxin-antitoxin system
VKVVADTNIYVSAIIFGGKPQTILELAHDGLLDLFISDDILAETARVLRDKFHRTPEQLQADVLALDALTTRVQPTERIAAVTSDPTDDRILECAVAAACDRIVSGDADLLRMGSFRGLKILKVSEFLAAFQAP